jgi:hypothetical protein
MSSRMKKTSFREKDVSGPPGDDPWLPFGYTLLKSDAWLSAWPHLRKLLDFLHIEHLRHDRQQNGKLLAPYSDLVKFGIGRRFILKAITEGERRGLIEVDHGLSFANGKRAPSRFRLTYFHTRAADANHAPTNEWRHYVEPTPEKIVLVEPKGELGPVHDGELGSEPKLSVSAKNQVHDREPGASARWCTTSTDSPGSGNGRGGPAAGRTASGDATPSRTGQANGPADGERWPEHGQVAARIIR